MRKNKNGDDVVNEPLVAPHNEALGENISKTVVDKHNDSQNLAGHGHEDVDVESLELFEAPSYVKLKNRIVASLSIWIILCTTLISVISSHHGPALVYVLVILTMFLIALCFCLRFCIIHYNTDNGNYNHPSLNIEHKWYINYDKKNDALYFTIKYTNGKVSQPSYIGQKSQFIKAENSRAGHLVFHFINEQVRCKKTNGIGWKQRVCAVSKINEKWGMAERDGFGQADNYDFNIHVAGVADASEGEKGGSVACAASQLENDGDDNGMRDVDIEGCHEVSDNSFANGDLGMNFIPASQIAEYNLNVVGVDGDIVIATPASEELKREAKDCQAGDNDPPQAFSLV